MVGSSILKQLKKIKNVKIFTASRARLNLCNQYEVERYFKRNKFDEVYMAAARVGGIKANSDYPAEFLYENSMIQLNIINSAFISGVKKLLFLGSSCIYPKNAKQPMVEEELLNGYLEKTNEPYAIAKISGIKLCQYYTKQYDVDYRCLMPTNLYGPEDNFNLDNAHVIPSLLRKFHNSKVMKKNMVEIWGTGKPKREFLHVADLAKASLKVMSISKKKYSSMMNEDVAHLNVGTGLDISIKNLAILIKEIVGFEGKIFFNTKMPDGTKRKLLCINKINAIGWKSTIDLKTGLSETYKWYLDNLKNIRS